MDPAEQLPDWVLPERRPFTPIEQRVADIINLSFHGGMTDRSYTAPRHVEWTSETLPLIPTHDEMMAQLRKRFGRGA
jgi:hypothetical protein